MSLYTSYSKNELLSLCKERSIRGYSGKKKLELIKMLDQDIASNLSDKNESSDIEDTAESSIQNNEYHDNREIYDSNDIEFIYVEALLFNLIGDIIDENDNDDILSSDSWKNTTSFASIKDKETQLKYYKKNHATEEVLQLVALESKPFGSEAEKIISEILQLKPRTSSQNDATYNNKKIEIKSARYWVNTENNDCKWQHLELDHDYEYVLFVLLDFTGWKIWCISKKQLMGELRNIGIITYQGKQGWWVSKNKILPYLCAIKKQRDLDYIIQ